MLTIHRKMKKLARAIAVMEIFLQLFFPVFTNAASTIPGFYGNTASGMVPPTPSTLPVLKPDGIVMGAAVPAPINNELTIHQTEEKAILEWDTFDIGEFGIVRFDQRANANWSALNRIFDKNPTQIYGKLISDGRIYLLNANGILFSPTSRMKVHSLTASSLDLAEDIFLKGISSTDLMIFKGQDNNGVVSNHGIIETDTLGSVFLLGPSVENAGTINAPSGQIGLASGNEIGLKYNSSGGIAVLVNDPGTNGMAINYQGAQLIAAPGVIGMYGRIVNQEGVVRSVYALNRNGRVELLASEKVSTGAQSTTDCLISDSPETAHYTFPFKGGEVTLGGYNTTTGSTIIDSKTAPKIIDHKGGISAPSGQVSLKASERVFLDISSSIDVSGLSIDKQAQDNQVKAQLNTVQLRDDFGQKQGVLKGENIETSALNGSAIGDISGSINKENLTARERSTLGGEIHLASGGDIIAKQGAACDFSGGSVHYFPGAYSISKLISGTNVYDISDTGKALEWIAYDGILGSYEKTYRRYGLKDTYTGVYYGGVNPLKDYSSEHIEGGNAGSIFLSAPRIAFEGTMDGSVKAGFYQTKNLEPTKNNKQAKSGWVEPKGGSLIIGEGTSTSADTQAESYVIKDFTTDEVIITSGTGNLLTQTGPDPSSSPYPQEAGKASILSSDTINTAGLDSVKIGSNSTLTIDQGASVKLNPGGTFVGIARLIKDYGAITVPSGSVTLQADSNITSSDMLSGDQEQGPRPNPQYTSMSEGIYLDKGSVVDAAGLKVDNSLAQNGLSALNKANHLTGGSITLKDRTLGDTQVVLMEGSKLDVSGGYEVKTGGKLNGADAGNITVQGASIILDSDLNGYSLPGNNGGGISLHAGNVSVTSKTNQLPEKFSLLDELPKDMQGALVLSPDRFADTGLTKIELKGMGDLLVEAGASLSPSFVKRAYTGSPSERASVPSENYMALKDSPSPLGDKTLMVVKPEYAGVSSLSLKAGEMLDNAELIKINKLTENLKVSQGSILSVASGGKVEIKAPNVILEGAIDASSGTVSATATGPINIEGNVGLKVANTAEINAAGWNRQDEKSQGPGLGVSYTPQSAGKVSLSATLSDLTIEEGARIDVSGSQPTPYQMQNKDGTFSPVMQASTPGSIALSYGNELNLKGDVIGKARLDGLKGGSLSISKTSNTVNAQGDLAVSSLNIARYKENGFDDLTLKSTSSMLFDTTMDISLGRSLTLDAPSIKGVSEEGKGLSVNVKAPYVKLTNSSWSHKGSADPGDGDIKITGEGIDIESNLVFAGFKNVTLDSGSDIRLTDSQIQKSPGVTEKTWSGRLLTTGDLTMKARTIYPTTQSTFTIVSQGTFKDLPAGNTPDNLILSAGGSIDIEAKNLDISGTIAAPLGHIGLKADERVYLAGESKITTSGKVMVPYGDLKDTSWTAIDKTDEGSTPVEITGAPEKSITMESGKEVIVRQGAQMDVSGGGSIFSYYFQPGINGSFNPLQASGRFVIVPGVSLPGNAVVIEDGSGLPAGTYSILPESSAFLPGAYVITDTGTAKNLWESLRSQEGYPLSRGYVTMSGTNISSSVPHLYSIRPATEVLKEGGFTQKNFSGKDAGSITINSPTTILEGQISGKALDGARGGIFSVSANDITLSKLSVALPEEVNSSDPLPEDLTGKCIISSEGLTNRGLDEVNIGDLAITKTITMKDASSLNASKVKLQANDSITIENGAIIDATGEKGMVELVSPKGSLTIEENALVHASKEVDLDSPKLDLKGQVKVDLGILNLLGDAIYVVPDTYSAQKEDGLYLTQDLKGFSGFNHIGLKSRSTLNLVGDVTLNVPEQIDIDAAGIVQEDTGSVSSSTITSKIITLKNTLDSKAASDVPDKSNLTFNATEMAIGHGDIHLDGFAKVAINCEKDLTFKGKGSLTLNDDRLASGSFLNVKAARITSSFYPVELPGQVTSTDSVPKTDISYEVTGFRLDAGQRPLLIEKSQIDSTGTGTPGGTLDITAKRIDNYGVLDMASGRIKMESTGSADGDGIFLKDGSMILTKGSESGRGGEVDLVSARTLVAEAGSLVDVSAGSLGDAGKVELRANGETAVLEGELKALATIGNGGSFLLDTHDLQNFSALNEKLKQGGFNNEISLRAQTGNVKVNAADAVRASTFELIADKGAIAVDGSIDASGEKGGRVELHAGSDITLASSAVINAAATLSGQDGGEVRIGSSSGGIDFASGSHINVSGGPVGGSSEALVAAGDGGHVYLRALQDKVKAQNIKLNGKISGASGIVAEAVQVYQDKDNKIDSSDISAYKKNAQLFMNSAAPIKAALLSSLDLDGTPSDVFHLVPGIEVQSQGDLAIGSQWDLTSWKFNNEPGILTLRALGDMNITSDIISKSASNITYRNIKKSQVFDSWGINLASGADLLSAEEMAVIQDKGNLSISNAVVYSESSPIRFSSGKDTNITFTGMPSSKGYMVNSYMVYNLATFDGAIRGRTGQDLIIGTPNSPGAIQSATGDIDLKVGGSMTLDKNGAVRTTGWNPDAQSGYLTPSQEYWKYRDGGDIRIDCGKDVFGDMNFDAWDEESTVQDRVNNKSYYYWSARYSEKGLSNNPKPTTGIATMGGGDVRLYVRGDFAGQAGAFGQNDPSGLEIYSGGDIDGRFLVRNGDMVLNSMGSFGSRNFSDKDKTERFQDQAIEVFDGRINVTAQGDILLGTILNPGIASPSARRPKLTYEPSTTSAYLRSVMGDVTFTGMSGPYKHYSDLQNGEFPSLVRILPPTLDVEAGGDIRFMPGDFLLTPSRTANLRLRAGGDITGNNEGSSVTPIYLSDLNPDTAYNWDPIEINKFTDALKKTSSDFIHNKDAEPVVISAGGDISGLKLYLSKKADISAGNDIRSILVVGQNLDRKDVSIIRAGNDIVPTPNTKDENVALGYGITYGGPGTLLVQAGDTIDLGISSGIKINSNIVNQQPGCSLMILAGVDRDYISQETTQFINAINKADDDYHAIIDKDSTAAKKFEDALSATIKPLFSIQGTPAGVGVHQDTSHKGRIEMTRSQISAAGDKSSIYMVSFEDVNVGMSAFMDETARNGTGISTESGGSLNIFAKKDVNVLESRVMTKFGGNIIVWSDTGDINAGRGSKTTISASEPQQVWDDNLKTYVTKPVAVAVGSGIRTLTYDPDGSEGLKKAPPAGDAFIFAPSGVIDAGEAGIAAENIILQAREVRNAQNIEVSGISVGMPTASENSSSIAALSGSSNLNEAAAFSGNITGVDSEKAREDAKKLTDAFVPKWIKVMVIGFGDDDQQDMPDKDQDKSKDKNKE